MPAGGTQTVCYMDGGCNYRRMPWFFAPQKKSLTPDQYMTNELI
ncbi:hypothetical protein PNW85_17510 [[Ruminococcus] gnavus]|uniref:Uncharacterized protein n=1 Tax=Mediterraneibacter gnavus TaxID=33038 RepID=A0AAW6DMZ5_MEDGN|nr:hypothetical protein [Mediterraneibacter gnavus]MDB8681369.1 hypothetical protein [Mediterraneibacter gnavus]MDB8688422.1 hypothetical protein [Mediterraneibacter gnavus]MDB8692507.1 hypothetical protein [Mediterraneibacter gnavus]